MIIRNTEVFNAGGMSNLDHNLLFLFFRSCYTLHL